MIYGIGLLAISFIIGNSIGLSLGTILGVDTNIGGVAFAMILLLIFSNKIKLLANKNSKASIAIITVQNMYIPVCIAMTASQNVVKAITSGWISLLGGLIATIAGFLLIPLISKLDIKKEEPKYC